MTTRRLIAQLAGTIEWRLSESTQKEFPLVGFPGWHLRSPLYWAPDEAQFAELVPIGKLGTDMILSSRGLSFTCETEDRTGGFGSIAEVLRRLRYVTRQFSIPRQIVAVSQHDPVTNPQMLTDTPRDFSGMFVRNYRMPTALADRHLLEIAAMSVEFSVPVHADVLLDALEAHVQQDYRKALLYAAIAVEAFARQQIEAAAVSNLVRAESRHRGISFPVSGGASVMKDPVSDVLIQSDNFARLLHEAPLYVLGRSLLAERPNTYRDALRLYATRNKIAHLGAPIADDKNFSATSEGSGAALHAAVDAIGWFGDSGPYIVWDGDFVSAADGRAASLG